MASQLRPTRLDVTDRFPMLGFTIRTDSPPRVAEIVLATDPALFTAREGRTASTFYSSREHGLLSVSKGEAVYVVAPAVLARFVAAERLWFGLATASSAAAPDWSIDLLPTPSSPYVKLTGFSDRALRRVRMFPSRTNGGAYGAGAPQPLLEWAGDRARPGMTPAPAAAQPEPAGAAPAPQPADVPYDDGFGPLPPLNGGTPPAGVPEPPAPAAAPVAQSYGRPQARAFETDPESMGIEEAVVDEAAAAQPMALQNRPRALAAAEYSGVTRIMPSPAYNDGRRGQAIDRIVIHITGAPQSPHIGSWFAREEANSSAHYMVDQNGAIIQFVREQDTAWHARGANRRSIGIEHVAIQRGGARYGSTTYPFTPPTDAEYRASAALVAHLCHKYGLTPDRTTIIGHSEADPRTTHTACPNGAWDWDLYMALVAECHAALAPAGAAQGFVRALNIDPEAMGIDGPACSPDAAAPAVQAGALALTAAEYDRVARIAPSPAFTAGRNGQAINRIVIHITDAPTTSSTVSHFTRADANSSAHYLVGQDGEIVQFVSEDDTAWHARGSNRNSIGIEHVAVKQGGVTYGSQTYPYMPPTDIQYSESAALVTHLCDKYGLTPDRTTIIGHREADTGTTHTSCPDGAWNWDHFMDLVVNRICAPQPATQALGRARSRAMSGDGQTVEIKYRAFIPSPALKGPLFDNYHGDGRGFSYSGGTSRGEVTFLVDMSPGGGLSNLRYSDRHWSPSHSYSASDTPPVSGKPDWWLDLNAGATPTGTGTCPANDDTLRAYIGAPGTTRNVLATAEMASIASVYMSGNNPLVPGSPAIDADVSVLLRRTANGIEARAYGSHDGFPAHELYVNGQRVYGYDPVAAGNGPTALFPPEDIDVDTGWVAVSSTASAMARAMVVGREDRQKIRDLRAHEWRDLFQWNFQTDAPREVVDAVAARGFTVQTIASAAGDLNLDFYKVEIGRFPDGWDGPKLLDAFIRNINNFVDTDLCSFDPYDQSDAERLRSGNPLGAVLNLDLAGPDNAAVVISSAQPQFYAVTTIETPDTGSHPVSGHRQFGWFTENGKTYFYTRGADRATWAPPGVQRLVFYGGEALWEDFQRRVAGFITSRGGEARIVPPYSERFNATAVRQEFGGLDVAQSLSGGDWSVNWDEVYPVPQPTDMSCWATAAAMILGWRDRMSVSPDLLAHYNGLTSSLTSGLAPGDKRAFAEALGLVVHPNACYTAEGFRDILEANGPIWVTAKVPGVHAIVVTGMYLENGSHYVRITDPWDRVVGTPGAPGSYAATHNTGSQYIMTYEAFSAEFEAAGDIDRIQLLHTGGTHGHTINRGSARGAGYAQALGDAPAPGDDSLGVGTVLTRTASEQEGRRYDLAQLSGMVMPASPPAVATSPLPGTRIVLDDWPYIEGPSGRTQAAVAIDWQYQAGGVGNIAIAPSGGQLLDGWSAAVRADIVAGETRADRVQLKVRVTTTFSRSGEQDQVAVSEVDLSGDGRIQTRHGADRPSTAPSSPSPGGMPDTAPAPQRQVEPA